MKSIFEDKDTKPTNADLKKALGKTYKTWEEIETFTKKIFAQANADWNFGGTKYGWSFRISDKKRVLVYLLPRDKFFKVGFVFGQKAYDKIVESDISQSIKDDLKTAKVYAEGRGIRIEIKDNSLLKDIKQLVSIKISS